MKNKIIQLLIVHPDLTKDLLTDQYGIFILHKVLKVAKGSLLNNLLMILAKVLVTITITTSNQQIINKLYKNYPDIKRIQQQIEINNRSHRTLQFDNMNKNFLGNYNSFTSMPHQNNFVNGNEQYNHHNNIHNINNGYYNIPNQMNNMFYMNQIQTNQQNPLYNNYNNMNMGNLNNMNNSNNMNIKSINNMSNLYPYSGTNPLLQNINNSSYSNVHANAQRKNIKK